MKGKHHCLLSNPNPSLKFCCKVLHLKMTIHLPSLLQQNSSLYLISPHLGLKEIDLFLVRITAHRSNRSNQEMYSTCEKLGHKHSWFHQSMNFSKERRFCRYQVNDELFRFVWNFHWTTKMVKIPNRCPGIQTSQCSLGPYFGCTVLGLVQHMYHEVYVA